MYSHALLAIRERLLHDAKLNDFFAALYDRSPGIYIDKYQATIRADEYPYISIFPGPFAGSDFEFSEAVASFAVGVKDDVVLEYGARARVVLADACRLMLEALYPQPLFAAAPGFPAVVWQGEVGGAQNFERKPPIFEVGFDIMLNFGERGFYGRK